MNRMHTNDRLHLWDRVGRSLLQVAALALILVMATPVRAADSRSVKSRVPPVYPEIAKRLKIGGTVQLEATVNAQGKVMDVKTVSGNHILSLAAEDAVRKWQFAPGSEESNVEIAVDFASPQ
jgi:TonB family protein